MAGKLLHAYPAGKNLAVPNDTLRFNNFTFARYKLSHAASSSGEIQSRARTDSLSATPLNSSNRSSVSFICFMRELRELFHLSK